MSQALRAIERFGRIVLAYNLFVIVWGAFVRTSGSGAGCGDHWPLCDGALIPATPTISTLIELFHRATSGLALVLVVLLFLRIRRHFADRHPVRIASAVALAFIVIEALIGALIVRAELFGTNASITRAAMTGAHFVNTLLLLAALTVTVWWIHNPMPRRPLAWDAINLLMLAACVGWLLLGATGALSALSRTLYPSSTLVEAIQKELTPGAPLLIRLRSLHPLVAAVMGVILCVLAWLINRRQPNLRARKLAVSITAIFFAQCLLGLVNVLAVVPQPLLQVSHLLMMDALWICSVVLAAIRLAEPAANGWSAATQQFAIRKAEASDLQRSTDFL
jgi:heme a synthase